MAKRKRLSPAGAAGPDAGAAAPETKSAVPPFGVQPATSRRPPIAQVAGEAAAQAALQEVASEMDRARTEGRMVLDLPLAAVDENYLVRDRMDTGGEEMAALVDSIRRRGQQTPIEVAELGQGRYGLISGWRRLEALRRLHEEGGADAPATVRALLRRPDTAAEAYVAMVEENEIRLGLSYYERARIVARAAEQGVYRNEAAALKGLFGNTSRARRSKIGTFLKIHAALDSRLRFPAAIPERLGLTLARALEADPGLRQRLGDRLRKAVPQSPEDELAVIERVLKSPGDKSLKAALDTDSGPGAAPRATAGAEAAPGIRLTAAPGRLVLSGPGVDDALAAALRAWLARRPRG